MTTHLVAGALRLFSGAVARWQGCGPELKQRVYFANHTSNLDGPVLWASLPPPVRDLTRLIGQVQECVRHPRGQVSKAAGLAMED